MEGEMVGEGGTWLERVEHVRRLENVVGEGETWLERENMFGVGRKKVGE